jgi:hypothetical protein
MAKTTAMPLTMAAARATFQLWAGKIYKRERVLSANHSTPRVRQALLPFHQL